MVQPEFNFVVNAIQQCILIDEDANILAHLAMYMKAENLMDQEYAEERVINGIAYAHSDSNLDRKMSQLENVGIENPISLCIQHKLDKIREEQQLQHDCEAHEDDYGEQP